MVSTTRVERQPVEEAATGRAGLDRKTWALVTVVVLGAIMSALDATVVNVAIPTLVTEFDSAVSTISWVITGYLLAFATVIPLTGWVSERFGAKRVWLSCLAVFVAGSLLTGVARSVETLIVFRVLQGLAGGMILPMGQAMLARAVGPRRVGRVMSVVGVPMMLAPIFGPVLGGAIIEQASWRWIFFINLPIGVAAIISAWRLLPTSPTSSRQRLDVLGVLLLTPGIALLIYGLSRISASGTASAATLGEVVAGLGLIAGFLRHAWARPDALLDLSLFRRRGFAIAALTTLLVSVALFGTLLLIPLYFQVVRGQAPLGTGLLLVPQGLGAALAMPFAGRFTDRARANRVVAIGILLAALGIAAYTQVTPGTPYPVLAGALFIVGLGLGSTFVPAIAVAFQSVAPEAMSAASSALNTIQRIAGSIGTALLAVVLQRAIAAELPALTGGLNAVGRLPAEHLAQVLPPLGHAFEIAFWVALALTVAAVGPALMLRASRAETTAMDRPA